ncbi:MAG: VTT domain-containing protein [bacterium]
MESIIAVLQHWIQVAGGLGVFGASVFEEVFSIIPSSVVQTAAGIFIMAGLPINVMSVLKLIVQVAIPSALGVTVGSLVYVWLARKFGILLIEKHGKWIGVSMGHIRKLEKKLENSKWDDVVFVFLRAFPAVPAVALAVYAGILEMPWKKYMVLTFIGVFIRATLLGFMGWMFRDSFTYLNDRVSTIATEILLGLLVIGVVYLVFSKYKNYFKTYGNK